MTVTEVFETFRKRLELTEAERKRAAARHPNVRETISKGLELIEDFLTGSYKRDTKIRPLSDIDLFVVLHWGKYSDIYYNNGDPSKILYRLRSILKRAYPQTPIKIQNRSVNLDFSDFGFDVVPAFRNEAGFYRIPDRNKGIWIKSKPKHHDSILSSANSKCDLKLKPIIKMFKSWNRSNREKLKSFHIEVMSLKAFKDGIDTSFQQAIRRFFDWTDFSLNYPCYDPANTTNQIDDYLTSTERTNIKSKLQNAKSEAGKALGYERNERHNEAIRRWRDLFGYPFPSP